MSRRNRSRILERIPYLRSGTDAVDDNDPPAEIPQTREDFEYFRRNPAKKWRVRQEFPGERVMLDARISLRNNQVIVFRPRPVNPGDPSDAALIFFKASVTMGADNDVADPWMYVGHGFGSRASAVWRLFQTANIDDGYGLFLQSIEDDAGRLNEFRTWCAADIERTARLSWSLYSSAPLMRKLLQEDGLEAMFSEHVDSSLSDLEADMTEGLDDEPDIRKKLEDSMPLIAGWRVIDRWATRPHITLEPSMNLFLALPNATLPSSRAVLPRESVLVDISKLDLPKLPECDRELRHGYLFTSVVDGNVLQVGELGFDGRISFAEFAIGDETWESICRNFRSEAFQDTVSYVVALHVFAYHTIYRNRYPSVTQHRKIGREILCLNPAPVSPPPAKRETPMAVNAQSAKPDSPTRSPISDLLARIQAAYEERQQTHTARIADLQQALDGYAQAAKNDLTVDFAKRNGVEDAGELQAPDAALYLLELIERLPELGGAQKRESADTGPRKIAHAYSDKVTVDHKPYRVPIEQESLADVAQDDKPVPSFPKLRESRLQVVLIGGRRVSDKMPFLESVLGYEPEWIPTEGESGSRESQALASRIERRDVVGVVFFQAFMAHKQTEPLAEAGRASGVPVIAGGRAGQGEIARALAGIEQAL